MSEACPGQSTSVNCAPSYVARVSSSTSSGKSARKDEKPRSSVMPLDALCGALSSDAVLNAVEMARASDVFPLSMCPRMPTLTFNRGFVPMSPVSV